MRVTLTVTNCNVTGWPKNRFHRLLVLPAKFQNCRELEGRLEVSQVGLVNGQRRATHIWRRSQSRKRSRKLGVQEDSFTPPITYVSRGAIVTSLTMATLDLLYLQLYNEWCFEPVARDTDLPTNKGHGPCKTCELGSVVVTVAAEHCPKMRIRDYRLLPHSASTM